MNFPVSKKIPSTPTKTDLASIWMKTPKSSSVSSPPSSPDVKPHQNILSLLSLNVSRTPKKTLHCPPVMEVQKVKKPKIVTPDSLYSNISFTSKRVPAFADELLNRITFVFKGNENQEIAWDSFKKVYKTAKRSVVAGPNLSFYFANGKVYGKSLTSSAQRKLESLSSSLPLVDEEKAIGLIDEMSKNEKLSIFSTTCFNYGVVTPIIKKESEIGSSEGNLKRVTFVGYMFPDFCDKLDELYNNCDAKKYTVSVF